MSLPRHYPGAAVPIPPQPCIIITGNPVDGFAYHGPFNNHDEAVAYGSYSLDAGDWWVTDLQTPECDHRIWDSVKDVCAACGAPAVYDHWMPTHYSKLDGSPARYVGMEGDALQVATFENENGDTWVDDLADWIEVAKADAEDVVIPATTTVE